MIAVETEHLKVVETLLSARANLNAVDNKNYTALTHAAAQGCPDVVKPLLAAGAGWVNMGGGFGCRRATGVCRICPFFGRSNGGVGTCSR